MIPAWAMMPACSQQWPRKYRLCDVDSGHPEPFGLQVTSDMGILGTIKSPDEALVRHLLQRLLGRCEVLPGDLSGLQNFMPRALLWCVKRGEPLQCTQLHYCWQVAVPAIHHAACSMMTLAYAGCKRRAAVACSEAQTAGKLQKTE